MKKKSIVASLLVCAMLLLLPFNGLKVQAAQASGEGWSLSEDGHLVIESQDGMYDWAEAWIADANEQKLKVNTVKIESGVTYIQYEAFFEAPITQVEFPDTLQTIGERSFISCSSLKSIIIPKSVTYIDSQAFAGTGLENITFVSENPPTIVGKAFENLVSSNVNINVPKEDYFGDDYKATFGTDVTVNGSQQPGGEVVPPTGDGDGENKEENEEVPPIVEEDTEKEEVQPGDDNVIPPADDEDEKKEETQPGGDDVIPPADDKEETQPGGDDVTPPTGDEENKDETQPGDKTTDPSAGEGGNRGENAESQTQPQSSPVREQRRAQQPQQSQTAAVKITYKTTSTVAGKPTTVKGVYFLEKGFQAAVLSEIDVIRESFQLNSNETPFVKIADMDAKRSHLAAKSLNDTAAAMGMKCVGYLNMEIGKMSAGHYRPMEGSKTVNFAVQLPANAPSGNYDILRVTEGGKVDLLKTTLENKVMTFESTPGSATYAIVMY